MAPETTPELDIGTRKWLSLGVARELLGVNEATLRQWADNGLVRAFRTPGGHRRFASEDIQSLLSNTSAGPAGHPASDGAAVLPRIRRKVDGTRPTPPAWMSLFDEAGQQRMRLLGRSMVDLCMDAVRGPSRRDLLKGATALGQEYGTEISERGVSLAEAVEGFVFFRHATMDAIRPALQQSGHDAAVIGRVWQQLGRLTDEVLLGLTRAYGPTPAPRRGTTT